MPFKKGDCVMECLARPGSCIHQKTVVCMVEAGKEFDWINLCNNDDIDPDENECMKSKKLFISERNE